MAFLVGAGGAKAHYIMQEGYRMTARIGPSIIADDVLFRAKSSERVLRSIALGMFHDGQAVEIPDDDPNWLRHQQALEELFQELCLTGSLGLDLAGARNSDDCRPIGNFGIVIDGGLRSRPDFLDPCLPLPLF